MIYSKIYYQVNQTDKHKNRTVNFVVQTSLDQNREHKLADKNLDNIDGLVIEAYQYLTGLLPGGSPAPEPGAIQLLLDIRDTPLHDIFQLTVLFSILRLRQQVGDDFKDDTGVSRAQTYLDPVTVKNSEKTHSLKYFASQFEKAYTYKDYFLKIAPGMSRFGTADSGESKKIWVVRLATDASKGIYYKIGSKATFYAPRPLSNSLVSKKVPVIDYDTFDPSQPLDNQITQNMQFSDIDLDKWGRQALSAIDLFLMPQFAVPAFKVDKLGPGDTSYYKSILDAKGDLADSIKSTVFNILEKPAVAPDSNKLIDAREKLRQQLLIKLANAYNIDAIVQYEITVASPYAAYTGSNNTAPRLYGKPLGHESVPGEKSTVKEKGKSDRPASQAYSLSTAKIPLNNGKSFLSFAFSARNVENQAKFDLDLGYQISYIEHEIGIVEGIEGYQASSWLNFAIPLKVIPISNNVSIPVLLRAYPPPPSLLQQEGIAPRSGSKSDTKRIENASLWDYRYTYSQLKAAQDVIHSEVEFNIPIGGSVNSLMGEKVDLFTALAQFVSAYPKIQDVFSKKLPSITLQTSTGSGEFKEVSNRHVLPKSVRKK